MSGREPRGSSIPSAIRSTVVSAICSRRSENERPSSAGPGLEDALPWWATFVAHGGEPRVGAMLAGRGTIVDATGSASEGAARPMFGPGRPLIDSWSSNCFEGSRSRIGLAKKCRFKSDEFGVRRELPGRVGRRQTARARPSINAGLGLALMTNTRFRREKKIAFRRRRASRRDDRNLELRPTYRSRLLLAIMARAFANRARAERARPSEGPPGLLARRRARCQPRCCISRRKAQPG